MIFRSSPTARCLLAGVAAVFLLASATEGQAGGWPFNIGKTVAPPARLMLAQAGDQAGRLDSVEAQMRSLTGQIEQLTHQLQVLQDQLKRMQDDNEFRFSELEKGAATKAPGAKPADQALAAQTPPAQDLAAAPPQTPAAPVPGPLAPAAAPVAAAKPSAVKPQPPAANGAIAQQLGAPPQPLGTLAIAGPPSTAQPLDLSSLAGGGSGDGTTQPPAQAPAATGAQTASAVPTGDPRADYDQAYNLINAGQYDLAEKAFRQFLATYPNDEQAADAQYWLGEALYDRGDYAGAAQEFKTGYTKYPNSKRAPDTLLKLGLSMAGLDYRAEACKMYALALKKYPQMSNALRQRVKTEQASAAC
jgi:tol-pal system protein YbgF